MKVRIARLRAALARRIRYRITKGGVLFVLATILVGTGALVSANNLLFLILAAMLSTLLVSGFVSRLCLAGLELDFIIPEHATARTDIAARLYVRNSKLWMPSFSIQVSAILAPGAQVIATRVYFPVIAGGATLDEPVDIRFPRRGVYQSNSFLFSTRFPFGFLEKTARVILRREVVVYPAIEPRMGFEEMLAGIAGDIESHYRGLGRDFYRIRPYEAQESARHLDWKATAKTGAMQIREFAREQERTVELFLDRNVPEGQAEWFETAVDCCAFLSWRLYERGIGVRFRSQGCDLRAPEETDIYTILKYLALVGVEPSRAAEPPADEDSYQLLFSLSPAAFTQVGWSAGRIIGAGHLGPDGGWPEHD